MNESFRTADQNASATTVNPVLTKAAEYFAKASQYEAPKVTTFPLHGMSEARVTSLTGNT
jgi:hypothetical protein